MGKFINSNEELIFKLFTLFDISIIEQWILEGLNKTKYAEKYKFEVRSFVHHPCGHKCTEISNYNFKVVLFYDDEKMCMSIERTMMDRNVTDDDFSAFAKMVFTVVNEKSYNFMLDEENVYKFFFSDICLKFSLEKRQYSLFEWDCFKGNPLAVAMPQLKPESLKYSVKIDSDFINGLMLDLEFKEIIDIVDIKVSEIHCSFTGQVLYKDFPIEEQIYLVEDATKELLSRKSMLINDLEDNIKDE